MRRDRPLGLWRRLQLARSSPNDPELQELLEWFGRRWLSFVAKRGWWLPEADRQEVINTALLRACERIAAFEGEIEDDDQVERWAALQLIKSLDGARKQYGRKRKRTADLTEPDDAGGEPLDRFPRPGRSPEDEAAARERLRMVEMLARSSRDISLRLLEDLPVEDVALRCNRTPAWIRTVTLRFRRAARAYFESGGGDPREIFERSGLPKDIVSRILQLLDEEGTRKN